LVIVGTGGDPVLISPTLTGFDILEREQPKQSEQREQPKQREQSEQPEQPEQSEQREQFTQFSQFFKPSRALCAAFTLAKYSDEHLLPFPSFTQMFSISIPFSLN
jgi:hypothetical protein